MSGNYACDNSMRRVRRSHQNLPVPCSQASNLLQALSCLMATEV